MPPSFERACACLLLLHFLSQLLRERPDKPSRDGMGGCGGARKSRFQRDVFSGRSLTHSRVVNFQASDNYKCCDSCGTSADARAHVRIILFQSSGKVGSVKRAHLPLLHGFFFQVAVPSNSRTTTIMVNSLILFTVIQ